MWEVELARAGAKQDRIGGCGRTGARSSPSTWRARCAPSRLKTSCTTLSGIGSLRRAGRICSSTNLRVSSGGRRPGLRPLGHSWASTGRLIWDICPRTPSTCSSSAGDGTCTWASSTRRRATSLSSRMRESCASRLRTKCCPRRYENGSSSHFARSATHTRSSSWCGKGDTSQISVESK